MLRQSSEACKTGGMRLNTTLDLFSLHHFRLLSSDFSKGYILRTFIPGTVFQKQKINFKIEKFKTYLIFEKLLESSNN